MLEENIISLIIILIGIIALGFLVSDKYPLETVSIILLSILIILQLICPNSNLPTFNNLI